MRPTVSLRCGAHSSKVSTLATRRSRLPSPPLQCLPEQHTIVKACPPLRCRIEACMVYGHPIPARSSDRSAHQDVQHP